jgi:hypothetical protein
MQRMVTREESNGVAKFDRTGLEGGRVKRRILVLAISLAGDPSATGGGRHSCGFASLCRSI